MYLNPIAEMLFLYCLKFIISNTVDLVTVYRMSSALWGCFVLPEIHFLYDVEFGTVKKQNSMLNPFLVPTDAHNVKRRRVIKTF